MSYASSKEIIIILFFIIYLMRVVLIDKDPLLTKLKPRKLPELKIQFTSKNINNS